MINKQTVPWTIWTPNILAIDTNTCTQSTKFKKPSYALCFLFASYIRESANITMKHVKRVRCIIDSDSLYNIPPTPRTQIVGMFDLIKYFLFLFHVFIYNYKVEKLLCF